VTTAATTHHVDGVQLPMHTAATVQSIGWAQPAAARSDHHEPVVRRACG
jgi:hypothetical protein